MTTPAPITTASFESVLHPQDVANVLNLLVGGSPFASTLTPYPTSRHAVAFPTAKPDRPAWLPEMGTIPEVGLGDDADIVAVAKLASIVLLSNEGFTDTDHNLTQEFGQLLEDSASAELDRGILYGSGAPEPAGVVAAAAPANGTDLAEAVSAAIGSIGDAGGVASHLCARPSALASARNTRDVGGQMVYPAGFGAAFGLAEVGVPELAAGDLLVIDATRVYLITRSDFAVDVSTDYAFARDAMAVRIRGRFAVGAPAVEKSLRKLVVAPGGTQATGRGKAA